MQEGERESQFGVGGGRTAMRSILEEGKEEEERGALL
jgi:hypothetical protein